MRGLESTANPIVEASEEGSPCGFRNLEAGEEAAGGGCELSESVRKTPMLLLGHVNNESTTRLDRLCKVSRFSDGHHHARRGTFQDQNG
jgi:hypothetical protein